MPNRAIQVENNADAREVLRRYKVTIPKDVNDTTIQDAVRYLLEHGISQAMVEKELLRDGWTVADAASLIALAQA